MNNTKLLVMLSLLLLPYVALQSIPLYYQIKYFHNRRSHRDEKKK